MIDLFGLPLLSLLAIYKSHGVSFELSSRLSSFATLSILEYTKYSLTTTATSTHHKVSKMSFFDLFAESVDNYYIWNLEDNLTNCLPIELYNAKFVRIFMLSDKDSPDVHFLERATSGDDVFIWVYTLPKWLLQTSPDGSLNLTGTCLYTPNAKEIYDRIEKHYETSNSYTEIKAPEGSRTWRKKSASELHYSRVL